MTWISVFLLFLIQIYRESGLWQLKGWFPECRLNCFSCTEQQPATRLKERICEFKWIIWWGQFNPQPRWNWSLKIHSGWVIQEFVCICSCLTLHPTSSNTIKNYYVSLVNKLNKNVKFWWKCMTANYRSQNKSLSYLTFFVWFYAVYIVSNTMCGCKCSKTSTTKDNNRHKVKHQLAVFLSSQEPEVEKRNLTCLQL